MYYFVSPNGTKYKTDKLKQFCEEKEITYHGAKKCLRGIQKHFADGWTVSQNVKEDQADITDQDHQEKNTDTENTNSDKEQGTEESTDSDKIVTAYV